ncbi:hypothetical protein DSM104443_00225 [Usitatibacter rugosus]|uniref:Glycine zipper domain-containing protein n=1 Tax=Usitatibacter rugosus TaxID=2732067 RepID=A0A6M4GPC5_9PROT|nr:hypothetical protein [Usitatibacter rugosus]QJR09189.1 hypothetical protein DSM104443_00225 [Usitatibacter rugosus]
MSTIIAGLFDTGPRAADAKERLRQAGVQETDMCEFVVNPPGQHDQYPIGGDRNESPGARGADGSAATGAVVGGAVGIAAGAAAAIAVGPIAIPLAAGVGAYTGSLLGALNGTDENPKREHEVLRTAGTMIAVNASSSDVNTATIARVMMECGAEEVERADGSWNYGVWSDFDPLSIPQRVDMPPPIPEGRRAAPPGH